MKLSKGDKVKVHGNLDIPIEDGFTYRMTGMDGQRYVFKCMDTERTVQVPYPAIDKLLDKKHYIERV